MSRKSLLFFIIAAPLIVQGGSKSTSSVKASIKTTSNTATKRPIPLLRKVNSDINILNATGICSKTDPNNPKSTSNHPHGCDLSSMQAYEIQLAPGVKITDLSGSNLEYTDLSNLDLSNAKLIGTDFTGATMTNTNLDNADLTGAILSNATLNGGTHAKNANFTNASLFSATLNADFTGSSFQGAGFQGADLTNANFSLANLTNLTSNMQYELPSGLSADDILDLRSTKNFNLAIFNQANMMGTNLSNMSLNRAELDHCNLSSANLENVTINDCSLFGTNLTKASLNNAKIIADHQAVFQNANFTGASLENVTIVNANFNGANFSGATLTSPSITNSTFENATFGENSALIINKMTGGSFQNTNLTGDTSTLLIVSTSNVNTNGATVDGSPLNLSGNWTPMVEALTNNPVIPNGGNLCTLAQAINISSGVGC